MSTSPDPMLISRGAVWIDGEGTAELYPGCFLETSEVADFLGGEGRGEGGERPTVNGSGLGGTGCRKPATRDSTENGETGMAAMEDIRLELIKRCWRFNGVGGRDDNVEFDRIRSGSGWRRQWQGRRRSCFRGQVRTLRLSEEAATTEEQCACMGMWWRCGWRRMRWRCCRCGVSGGMGRLCAVLDERSGGSQWSTDG